MRVFIILLSFSMLLGCASKRSPEEKQARIEMIKQGLDPDTGEPWLVAQRRKEQASANFSASLQRDLSNLSTVQRQERAEIEAASRGSSVALDRAKAERNARFAAVVAERHNDSGSSARRVTRERERKSEVAKREEAFAETKRKQEHAAQALSKEKSLEKAKAERVKQEKSTTVTSESTVKTSGAWLTSVNNSDRDTKTPEDIAAQKKRMEDHKKSEEAAATAAEREKAKKVAEAQVNYEADRKVCMKPENRDACGCLKYFPVNPARKVCGR